MTTSPFKFPKLVGRYLHDPVVKDGVISGSGRAGVISETKRWCSLIATLEGLPVDVELNGRVERCQPLPPADAALIYEDALDEARDRIISLRRRLREANDARRDLEEQADDWRVALFLEGRP